MKDVQKASISNSHNVLNTYVHFEVSYLPLSTVQLFGFPCTGQMINGQFGHVYLVSSGQVKDPTLVHQDHFLALQLRIFKPISINQQGCVKVCSNFKSLISALDHHETGPILLNENVSVPICFVIF